MLYFLSALRVAFEIGFLELGVLTVPCCWSILYGEKFKDTGGTGGNALLSVSGMSTWDFENRRFVPKNERRGSSSEWRLKSGVLASSSSLSSLTLPLLSFFEVVFAFFGLP